MEITLKDIVTILANNPKIEERNYPINFTEDLYQESHSQKDCCFSIKNDQHTIFIEFEFYASWAVSNNGGDGYYTPNHDEPEDIDIEVDILKIENEEEFEINLNDKESIKEIETWIIKNLF